MKKTILFTTIILLAFGCKERREYGRIDLSIDYSINQHNLITNSLCFTNEAGNLFLINEIQWFISRLELHSVKGDWAEYNDNAHYIDTDIPESHALCWNNIPAGQYDKFRFTFGLNENDNRTGRFVNPPESNMFWPDPLGGGYHYMKLNGKWCADNGELAPLNVHLGIGQNADHSTFYQNYFIVEQPVALTIAENQSQSVRLTMVIDNWFRNPNLYDFDIWGGSIMQNQAAQQALKENGGDVFQIQVIRP